MENRSEQRPTSSMQRLMQQLHWREVAVGSFLFFFAKGMVWLALAAWLVMEEI